LIDERGALTWSELAARADALAAGLAALPGGKPLTVAIMCRNHRGFVEALVAAGRLGATILLLNTGFAGPQLTEVLAREGADLVVHDEEFAPLLAGNAQGSRPRRVIAWTDTDTGPSADSPTIDGLIAGFAGRSVDRPEQSGRIVLLTSGTTGILKGARLSANADVSTLIFMLERIPWHTGERVVVPGASASCSSQPP
jgi:fatty-acyl-CoA synthase